MATINSREIVDAIIAGNGIYEDDMRVLKIVQYQNMFDGGTAYGLVYEADPPQTYHRYERSEACRNPKVIWEYSKTLGEKHPDGFRCVEPEQQWIDDQAREAYDISDPKHPDHHDVMSNHSDMRSDEGGEAGW